MIILLVATILLWNKKIDDSLFMICLMLSLVEIIAELLIVASALGIS